MNITLNKYLVSIVLLFCFSAAGQKVDTMTINGETYLVYPFKRENFVQNDYFRTIDLNEMLEFSYRHYRMEIFSEYGEELTLEEFKDLMKAINPRKMKHYDGRKYLGKKFIKAVRKNPYPLLEPRYLLNNDLTPSLDPIPDGKYVQLFEKFCVVDEKGRCSNEVRIAGYFSIKNNLLDGEAYWLNMQGDTLKQGLFVNGLKEGEWRVEKRSTDYSLTEKNVDKYIERGFPDADTTIIICNYKNGSKTGNYQRYFSSKYPIEEGEYKDGKPVGEWVQRDIRYEGVGFRKKRNRDNNVITLRYSLAENDSIISKKPWIRNGLIDTYNADAIEFNFVSNDYVIPKPPSDLFHMAFEKDPDLDLEEESFSSHRIGMYDDSFDYGYDLDYLSEYGSMYTPNVFDSKREDYFTRGYIIDSIGATANYEGVYESRYPNGQLAFRYEIQNGELLHEDTIFWENGEAHDVIIYDTDSNQYHRSIYDFYGKLFMKIAYDSLGDYKRVIYEFDNSQHATIDGLDAVRDPYSSYYLYDAYDTLDHELSEKLILFRSWFQYDSSRLYTTTYDPDSRTLYNQRHTVTGKISSSSKKTFGENYKNWNGIDSVSLGPLTLISTSSATAYDSDFYFFDTVPQKNVKYPYERFDVAEDHVLYKNGETYTGDVTVNLNKKNLSISKSGLTINLPKNRLRKSIKLSKMIDKYRTKGKVKDEILLNYIDASDSDADIGYMVYNDFISNIVDHFFEYPDMYGFEGYYEYGMSSTGLFRMVRLEGRMLNGKAHGVWTSYDSKGNVLSELTFENGEANGEHKLYDFATPEGDDYDYYSYEIRNLLDTFPEKETYYLMKITSYKNGMKEGKMTRYNWLNEILEEVSYEENMKNGPALERNKLAYSKMNFSDDLQDGYMRTYLTLPEKDSILLYDLNFQNGLLQGESRSYHLNGKLAKKGFFLNGDPIDDYEAYDSLGFKYHYVKFKYSYPIEEKIWEENQLSVRYLYDWQDSIFFEPRDIATSQSLESMLYKLGFGSDYLALPYYGRPSLVSKSGIKYHMTKYYPNDSIARDGDLDDGNKAGCWKFYSYEGELLYEVEYFDTIITLNDSIKFRSKGVLSELDSAGNVQYEAYIIEKFEKYDCSHSDHYEIRQYYTIWESDSSHHRINGYVKNYYDNGVLQSEGEMSNGLPTGFWKFYDPFGKLHQFGKYTLGKRDGRWLSGDLSKTKYLGDICLNPNLPDLEDEIKYRENLLDITITNYKLGKSLNKQYYDINMNRFRDLEEEEDTESAPSIEIKD